MSSHYERSEAIFSRKMSASTLIAPCNNTFFLLSGHPLSLVLLARNGGRLEGPLISSSASLPPQHFPSSSDTLLVSLVLSPQNAGPAQVVCSTHAPVPSRQ